MTPEARRRTLAGFGILMALVLAAIAVIMRPVYYAERAIPIAAAPDAGSAGVQPGTPEVTPAALGDRPVYPYSIVAGGAASADELQKAIDADPVVAGHYANFDLSKTRVEKLTKPKVAFVSYRMGNDIYWTRKPLVIRAGERILTDGENIARTRCANQLSALPGPTSEFEPPAVTLDTPVLQTLPMPPLALTLPPYGFVPMPPNGVSYPIPPSGIPVPPGTGVVPQPTGTRAPTDTNVEPPDEVPSDPPLPPPSGNPPAPPLPPITIDDPILPPPSPRSFNPPDDPDDPDDPTDPEDPPKDPPKDPPVSVPEPATSTLLLIAAGACAIGRRFTTKAHD